MRCIADGCKSEALYMLHKQYEPHCMWHFQEAIENCAVPTIIMSVEGYEEMIRKEKVSA